MAWEKRARGTRYYTRSRRVGGRVVREYLGAGSFAEALARQDATAQERRRAQATEEQRLRDSDATLAALVDDLIAGTDALAAATLVLAGYHRYHRGEWRRRRQGHDDCKGADERIA